jgi:signal transduction histidine kinase
MKAQENERQMISRELHDRIGQDLSMLKILCNNLFDNHSEVPDEMRQGISQLSKMLQDSINSVRDIAYDLRPSSLDQLGLVRTIYRHCEDFSDKTGLNVDFNSAGMDELKLDFDTEINLYRLVQESLNYIMKHADAKQVTIKLVASFPKIILRIEDDGKGFDIKNRLAAATNEKRMGIRSMKERVSLLNGKMRINSRPAKGTKIFIEVPYKG